MTHTIRLLAIIVLLALNMPVQADSRNFDQAKALAVKKAKSLGRNISDLQVNRAKAKAQSQAKGQSDYSHYYIFNFDDSTGYAVVSGDDQMPAIVGYSSRGSLDADSLPVQLKDFLQAYEATVDAVRNNDPTAVRNVKAAMARVAGSITPVEPLLGGIVWNQGAPFNNQCPIYDGENRAVTGCVATAMAQIMRYWKYPAQLMEDIGTYEVNYENNATGDTWTSTYGGVSKGITYDWGNMLESYNGDYNEAQANAVATLMSHCGLSVKMQYAGESGAYISDVSNALIKQFGYDEDLVQYLQRDLFEWDEWNEILQRELQAQRPIYYGGFASSGGHAFVCDGIDADGYYHINWGWGGMSDDYFDITILNPYDRGAGASASEDGFNIDNEIVIGIIPDNGTKDNPLVAYNKLTLISTSTDFTKFKRENSADTFTGTINCTFHNMTNSSFDGLVSVAIQHDEGSFTHIVSQHLGLEKGNASSIDFSVDYAFPIGTYKLYIVQSTDNGATWKACYGNQGNAITIKVTDQYLMTASTVPTEGIVIDGLKFQISSETLSAVVVANDYAGDIVIPSDIEYDGVTYTVTTIGDHCFTECDALTSVVLPETITSFEGIDPFGACKNLQKVVLSNNIKALPRGTFYECRSLTTLEIPESVTSFGMGCFWNCVNLAKVNIPDGVTVLPDLCFSGCESLESIDLPESLTTIIQRCFMGCTSLKSIVIPESVSYIGGLCFVGDSCLACITIPQKVSYIGAHCFVNCSSLTSIIIPDSVTKINESTFHGCSSLKEINIPNSITTINDDVFHDCTSLTCITIPDHVTSIGKNAFAFCSSLKNINIPSGVTYIGASCFAQCSSLEKICLSQNINELPDGCFSGCWTLKEINIPSGLTRIGESCFYNCSALQDVQLYEGLKEIGAEAFAGCSLTKIIIPQGVTAIGKCCFNWGSSLKYVDLPASISEIGERCFAWCGADTLICRAAVCPPINDFTFFSTANQDLVDGEIIFIDPQPVKAILFVPKESVDAYKTAVGWKNFNTILPLETVGIENAASGHQSKVSYYHLNGLYITGEPKQAGIYIRETEGKRQKIVIR